MLQSTTLSSPATSLATPSARANRIHLIAHRGLWFRPEEKNTPGAFDSALRHGFGIETDVRDRGSQLVISHDMPTEKCQSLEAFFELYKRHDANSTLAINIKADGLAEELKRLLNQFDITNHFVFDMSVPDSIHYLRRGITLFARRSEYEADSKLLDMAQGVWVDAFDADWHSTVDYSRYLLSGKRVCVVSPELHKRPHMPCWQDISNWLLTEEAASLDPSQFMLCTDYPIEFGEMLCR